VSYTYPDALLEVVKQRWATGSSLRSSSAKVPLPEDKYILDLLHIAFQASLLSEEGRPLSFRIVFCTPQELRKDVSLRNRNRPLIFSQPRPLSISELVGLAPAVDPSQSLIGVTAGGRDGLLVWGLVDAGLSWWEFTRGEWRADLGGSPPPDFLTVSSSRRGSLTVSRQGIVICGLHQGVISVPTLQVLTTGPFGDFLNPIAVSFHQDLLAKLGAKHYDKEGHDEDYPQTFVLGFIERILIRVMERGHGGTLLLVPDNWNHDDSRLRDRLMIKYPMDDADTWETLLKTLRLHRSYYDRYFPAWNSKTVKQQDFQVLHHLDHELADTQDLVRDRANLIARLTGVDGAVVLTTRLRLLGFGAEIVAQSPALKMVAIAEDAKAKAITKRPLEDFGTRHRSALRFCSTHEDVAALVVSQDGDIRAMLRVGADVVMWPSVGVSSFAV